MILLVTLSAPPVFFAVTFLATTFFMLLAIRWPQMVAQWQNVEYAMLESHGYPNNFGRRCKFCAVAMLTASTG
jgi:hypothetical protein